MINRLLSAALALVCAFSVAAQDKIEKGDINLIVVSDLGRNGYYDQKGVASTMGLVAEKIGPDAVLALGDTHHYEGVQSVSDPLWMTNYELIYSHPELMVHWYPVCGNHEYRGSTQAVLDYSAISRRWDMPARYYTKVFGDKDEATVRIVFIDTAPLIDKYRKNNATYPDACRQDPEAQLEWLDKTLADATEDWVVVVGHHPIYAFTDKPDSERSDLQKRVDPILRKHKADMYICGHIHNFQHVRVPGSNIDYITNTSGSLSRKVNPIEGTVFCSPEPGFSIVSADKKTLELRMIDKQGNVLHTVTRSK